MKGLCAASGHQVFINTGGWTIESQWYSSMTIWPVASGLSKPKEEGGHKSFAKRLVLRRGPSRK